MSADRAVRSAPRPLIALLDDDPGFRASAGYILGGEYEIVELAAEADLRALLVERIPDVLLLDIQLGEGVPDGFAVLERLRAEGHRFPVIVLTILAGLDVTGRALAMDVPFLQKDRELDADRFVQQIRLVLEASQLRLELDYHRRLSLSPADDGEFPWPPEGAGGTLRAALEPLVRSPEPLLLEGERDCGKRTTAHWVHRASGRRGPFYAVSPLGRAEDEFLRDLFGFVDPGRGYEPGAIMAAGRGTLLVEDLHLLSDGAHQKLIRAIESGWFRPPGGDRLRRVDCRILASRVPGGGTAGPPDAAIEAFWKPYRIRIPALREHPEDVPFHLDRLARRFTAEGIRCHAVDPAALVAGGLSGNFQDLRIALLHGPEHLGEDPDRDLLAGDVWRVMGRWQYRRFHDEAQLRYLREVERHCGRDVDCWRAHTGYERASVYRWFRLLDDDAAQRRAAKERPR